ncbi:DedA family protein [Pasteurellaceae bacterium HPA106]|uniref:DedA family protein n=1 Tax=Spirabiliibacterium pneumoniae TaxID=221400 RepID=UPI001AAC6B51|nr:DedA family protein [Spirabiliibacterium pneumoniae]MBE2896537.1 DedA family protein [Spirabiliibacterium pneumoniae]
MQFFIDFFTHYGYAAVFAVLILCGLGVPIPEDITLVSGGIISGLGYANPHWMVVVGMLGVLLGDLLMYMLGRFYGVKILRFRLIKRFITFKRLQMVKNKFDRYGNRLLFIARFLPGLRTPVYIISGVTRRVGVIRFILIDFCAAIISVPIWVYLGHHGAENIDWIKAQMRHGQMGIYGILGVILLFVLIAYFRRKRKANAEQE